MWAAETISFRPVVISQFVLQFRQRTLNQANEICAVRGHAAHARNQVAFGMIVRDHEHFAVRLKPMRRTFNHLIGSLARARK